MSSVGECCGLGGHTLNEKLIGFKELLTAAGCDVTAPVVPADEPDVRGRAWRLLSIVEDDGSKEQKAGLLAADAEEDERDDEDF